jgi:hypothetical protein
MRTKTTMKTLVIATAAFTVAGFMTTPKTFASADDTAKFYMEAGAAVNIDDESYGGIRWTTVVGEGYSPEAGAVAADVKFGTFVVPTATYQAANGTEIKDMSGVVDVKSNVTAADALDGEVVYYSAIKYDDIIEDYMQANGLTELADEQKTALLTEAYQLELTAVSYAVYDNVYYYATATETSRSARQVANMAILTKELENKNADAARIQQVNSYVKTGANAFERVRLDNANEGYLDLTELSNAEVTAQPITVSGLSALDFSVSGNVEEVLIGANKITDYTYADGTLSVSEGSLTLEAGKETWLSVFTKNGNVYSLPVIPADGVIRTAQDLNDVFGVKNAANYDSKNPDAWTEAPLYGYYVLGNDIVGDGAGNKYTMTLNGLNGGSPGSAAIVTKELGGFYGTFDGRGHTVSKLASRKYGIFGWVVNATIKNVAFKEVTSASNNANANNLLTYFAYNTTFENIYVDMQFAMTNGNSLIGYARSSTFNNVVLNVSKYSGSHTSSARSWGMLGLAYTWDAVNGSQHYGENNTFTNTYMISECMVAELNRKGSGTTETIENCVDGGNWATPSVGTSKNYTESGIKRYLKLADMFDNVYYNEDGSVNATATKTENDWTKFDNKYWNVDTANKTISWR